LLEIINEIIHWFTNLNQIFQTIILVLIGYIFILGLLEFIKKVLLKLPLKFFEVLCIGVIIYMLVINFWF
jgi:hypothetical protein